MTGVDVTTPPCCQLIIIRFELITSREIRSGFIDFFKSRGHTYVPSAPVVPIGDPTLLFTNAGMNQFKDIFLDIKTPTFTRAVNSQKCIRVSGKHNDLEEVGLSNRHHTFFEMLGNWSFGDYYKREAIRWAWKLFTEIWKLPKDRLYATVYLEDDEAEGCWRSETDIDHSRITRHGKKDNFWEMGEVGPCGPCSEIHYDLGADGCDMKGREHICEVNGVCGRYVELWNLVFIQYYCDERGELSELPAKHVDTGAGLERIAAVLQGGMSNYDSDLFQPLIGKIVELSGVEYADSIPHRVIADHLRALTFAIADGAFPSNEGRGYVLRRILRRASRFGHEIGLKQPFIFKLAPVLVDLMGDIYPEIRERHQHIALAIKSEEEGFTATLERGLDIFHSLTERLDAGGETIIPGEDAFKLYDTYGFPLDLTELMAREKGYTVDVEGFQSAMTSQKVRARAGGKFAVNAGSEVPWEVVSDIGNAPPDKWQDFIGYEYEDFDTIVVRFREQPEYFEVVVKDTPIYAEAGGQVGDTGTITTADGEKYDIQDSYYDEAGHRILKAAGDFQSFAKAVRENSKVHISVDSARRMAIQRNHTATHLLHYSLRKILGEHVQQAGSLVHPDYLRFDYTHYQKPEAAVLNEIELLVNRLIMGNSPVSVEITTFEDARKRGAMTLFGEKYGDEVRLISVGGFSYELCGGTHTARSGDIGYFRIVSETGVSAGIRRIEAVTGEKALLTVQDEHHTVEYFREALHGFGSDIREKLAKFVQEKRELEKEVERLRRSGGGVNFTEYLSGAVVVNGKRIVAKKVKAADMNALKDLGDGLRDKLVSGIGFLGAEIGGKASLVCVVTDDLIEIGIKAGDLVKGAAVSIGGGGGGKPHLATAGAKSSAKLDSALEAAVKLAEEALQ